MYQSTTHMLHRGPFETPSLTSCWATPSRFAKWKRTAEEWFRRDSEMFENLVALVRAKMVSRVLNAFEFGLIRNKNSLSGMLYPGERH